MAVLGDRNDLVFSMTRPVLYSSVFALCMLSAPASAQLLTGYGEAPAQSSNAAVPVLSPVLGPDVVPETQPVFRPFMTGAYEVLPSEPPVSEDPEDAPVDLQADDLAYDDQAQRVQASGNVFLAQSGRILRADTVAYDVAGDVVEARGHVVVNEENGDIHLADEALYNNRMRDGDINNLRTTLNDGSRFKAERGEHRNGNTTTMYKASYTPCVVCGDEPEEAPAWALHAREVTHDREERRVKYRDATFRVKGVPVAYTPYFSHPDGTIDQKSGFLSPSLGFRSGLGAFVENQYYWGIGADQDATVGLMVMTEEAPLLTGEYRKRWERGEFKVNGGITNSERTDSEAGQRVAVDDEIRGHVFAHGRWDINNKWRSGLNVNWTSDDQYMRQYDFTSEDVLENEVYVERFSGRDYASARLIAFQDIRVREVEDQPNVLPEIIANFQGEPGAIPVIKGNWNADVSVLGLIREGDEQDLQRGSLNLGWQRRLVSDYGLLTKVSANMRGDLYHTTDRQAAQNASGRKGQGTETRLFPQAHIESSYPMAREFDTMQARVAPVVSLTAAPNLIEDVNIPNEDSGDVQIDTSNLFEPNRFPGIDQIEDQSRVTYGLRSGLFAHDGSYLDGLIGQSYRLDGSDNPFPQGSGLDSQESDVVGSITGRYKDVYRLDYKFQLDARHLSAQRHEVDASADWNRFRIGTNYLFARTLEGTDISENREQLKANAHFYLSPEWRIRSGATQDLGVDPGLRESYASIDFLGQCVFWSLQGEKNFTNDESGDSDVEVVFRIGLKNLGDFETSGYRVETQNEKSCSLFN